jgi:hypothetical protein
MDRCGQTSLKYILDCNVKENLLYKNKRKKISRNLFTDLLTTDAGVELKEVNELDDQSDQTQQERIEQQKHEGKLIFFTNAVINPNHQTCTKLVSTVVKNNSIQLNPTLFEYNNSHPSGYNAWIISQSFVSEQLVSSKLLAVKIKSI